MINLLSVNKFSVGNTLLVMIGMYCFERKLLKIFAFSLQFKVNILFTRGGLLGALHLHHSINNLPIKPLVLGSFTLFLKFFK